MNWFDESGTQFGYRTIRHGQIVDQGHLYTSNVSITHDFLLSTQEYLDDRLHFCGDSEWGLRLSGKGFELRYNECARAEHLHEVDLESSLQRSEAIGRNSAVLRQVGKEEFDSAAHGVFEK